MSKNKNFCKKIAKVLLALALVSGFINVAYAATFGNSYNGASSEEVLQVKYDGAAWNYPGSGYSWASFKYSRDGKTLLTKTAYHGKVTGSVWDDLIRWGDKYRTKFTWNNG